MPGKIFKFQLKNEIGFAYEYDRYVLEDSGQFLVRIPFIFCTKT